VPPHQLRDLIRALRQFGFDGPFPGGNHQYMSKEQLKVTTFRLMSLDSATPHVQNRTLNTTTALQHLNW